MEQLTVRTRELAGWTVIDAVGQLDVATAPGFRQTLLEAQYGGGSRVALEVSGLEFIDSFGLGVIMGAVKRARTHDGRLALVCPPGRTRHVLEVSGVDRILQVVDHLDHLDDLDDPDGPDEIEVPGTDGPH